MRFLAAVGSETSQAPLSEEEPLLADLDRCEPRLGEIAGAEQVGERAGVHPVVFQLGIRDGPAS
jgi:hypothetical protein